MPLKLDIEVIVPYVTEEEHRLRFIWLRENIHEGKYEHGRLQFTGVKNISGNGIATWECTSIAYYFENKDDALKFKMRWG